MLPFVAEKLKEEFLVELVFDIECEGWLEFQEAEYEEQMNKGNIHCKCEMHDLLQYCLQYVADTVNIQPICPWN